VIINNSHINKWLGIGGIGFLLFFFFYGVNFTFLPAYTSQLIAAGVLTAIVIFSFEKRELVLRTDRSIQIVFALWCLLFLWVLMLSVVTMFQDIGLLVNTFLIFFQVFIGSLFFAFWFYKQKYSFRQVMRFIQVLIVIQALFIIIYFFSMDFKLLTLRFIPEGGNLSALHPYRSRGLTHGAGATLAAFQGTGMLITAYLILKAKNWKWTLFDLLCLGLLAASVMLTGRTGFIILPFIIGFLAIYTIYKSRISRKLLTSALLFPVVIVGGFLMMETFYTQVFGGGDVFSTLTRWAFGEFGDLLTRGESRTVNILLDEHLFFPEELMLFIFGDPTTFSLHRIPSDMGLVRRLFGTGLIGLTLIYTLVGMICYYSFKKAPELPEKLLIVVFTLWMFLLELKEPLVTDFRFVAFYLIIFCFYCIAPLQKMNIMRITKSTKGESEK